MLIKQVALFIDRYQKLNCQVYYFFRNLLAVAGLESLGLLFNFAEGLNKTIPNTDIVIGFLV